jgi:hypothetical protein
MFRLRNNCLAGEYFSHDLFEEVTVVDSSVGACFGVNAKSTIDKNH